MSHSCTHASAGASAPASDDVPATFCARYRLCRDQAPTSLFFRYNSALGPPYRVLLDTNFINFSIKNKARRARRYDNDRKRAK